MSRKRRYGPHRYSRWDRLMEDPKMRAIIEEIQAKWARSYELPCPYGGCVYFVDTLDNTTSSSWGEIECPCTSYGGRAAKYFESLSKPRTPVKMNAQGRNRSRAQRSKRRHDEFEAWRNSLLGE